MKFLIAPLCSDLTKPEEVQRCVKSILSQDDFPFDFAIKIVCNTNDPEYYLKIKNAVGVHHEVVQTESNGGNGMGHNSVLQLFRERCDIEGYTHLIMIDGDDFLYPSAFEAINDLLMLDPDIDYCGVGMNADSVRRGSSPNGSSMLVQPGIHLHSNFNNRYPIPMNPIYAGIENGCPGGEVTLFLSAKAVECDLLHLEYPMIPDDFTHMLWAVKHHVMGNLKYVSTDITDVYVYDKTNSVGTTNQAEFKFDPRLWPAEAVEYVRTNFADIVGITRGHLPFLTLPPIMFPGEKADFVRDNLLFCDDENTP